MERLVQPRRIPIEVQNQIRHAIRGLPTLAKDVVDENEMCAICLTPFSSILEEANEIALSQANEPVPGRWPSEGEGEESVYGITKLETCGHLFCRRDLIEWIKGFHGSCPTCRQPFLDFHIPTESDDESSDGGEYIPNPEDFEDEDDTYEFTDGFSELNSDNPDQDLTLDDYILQTGHDHPRFMEGIDHIQHVLSSNIDSEAHDATVESPEWYQEHHPFDLYPDFGESSQADPIGRADTPATYTPMPMDDDEDFGVGPSHSEHIETEDAPIAYTYLMDSDDEMDEDYIPMDEDDYYSDTDSDSSEPSFCFTDRDSEGVSSEIDDMGFKEMYPGAFAGGDDRASIHDIEDDMDLPDHEKGLSSTSTNRAARSEGSK